MPVPTRATFFLPLDFAIILLKAGIIMAIIANLGFPSALITVLPIIQSAKKGTPYNTTLKYSVAGSKIAPLAPNNKSSGL